MQLVGKRLVDEIWNLPTPSDMADVTDAELEDSGKVGWCLCGEGILNIYITLFSHATISVQHVEVLTSTLSASKNFIQSI